MYLIILELQECKLWRKSLKSAVSPEKGFPVAQMVEHGASNAKIKGSIPRESKSW